MKKKSEVMVTNKRFRYFPSKKHLNSVSKFTHLKMNLSALSPPATEHTGNWSVLPSFLPTPW